MKKHTIFSASASERWLACPGSVALTDPTAERTTSIYSAEGTLAHLVLTWALQQGKPAADWIGHTEVVDGYELTVDEEMVGSVQLTIDYVRDIAGDDGIVLVDQRVNYASYLDCQADDGQGTLDVAVLRGDEVVGIDLKYGKGKLVHAENNPQVSLYVLGILASIQGIMGDFTKARVVIHQPRVHTAPSEWPLTVAELEGWARSKARTGAQTVLVALANKPGPNAGEVYRQEWEDTFLRPGDAQCQWCPAAATCPKLRGEVASLVGLSPASPDEFADLEQAPAVEVGEATDEQWLAAAFAALDRVENWCAQVGAEVQRRLLAGSPVGDLKLVQGRQGPRAWRDEAEARAYLRDTMELPIEKAFQLKLITPTTAEKLHKAGDIGPRQWKKIQAMITRAEGKPHVAPANDPRPAYQVKPVAEEFTDLDAGAGQPAVDPLADIA